jgi:predicted acyltransferase
VTEAVSPATETHRLRLDSVDVMRGLTVGGMILVNQAGDYRYVYHHLDHTYWNGLTGADLVFPSFVFVMGVSIALALGPAAQRGAGLGTFAARIARRTLLLVGLGLLLNLIPYFDFSTLRIPGVLQRLGLAYALAACIFLRFPRVWQQAVIAMLLCVAYEALLAFAFTGDLSLGAHDRESNFAGQVDRWLFGPQHLFTREWDPEGLLGTLPTTSTALLGALAGRWLFHEGDPGRRIAALVVGGAFVAVVGLALHDVVPVNKNLWSATFVLVSAGASAVLLGAVHGLVDLGGWGRLFAPLRVLGLNALAIYVLSSLVTSLLQAIEVGVDAFGEPITLQQAAFRRFFLPLASPHAASLLFAVLFVLAWIGVAALLHRERIYVRL